MAMDPKASESKTRVLDETDKRLLNLLQESIPLVDRPFAALGQKLGLTESQVIARIQALKSRPRPIIRQISAIFDTRSLGYHSSLVAARIAPENLDSAVAAINAHPGVTHNYLRNHAYNVWYTLAVPPDTRLGLEKTVDILHQRSHAAATRLFPTLKLYKIGVSFNLSGDSDPAARRSSPAFTEHDRARATQFSITDSDKRIIRVLQQDLLIVERPFDAWAAEAQVSVDDLLRAIASYQREKRMRRFSAVLHHREAGFSANGMGAWAVPPDQHDQFGQTAAAFAAVSHCYLRPTYPDWPYSIFTMVHGKSMAECDAVLAAIAGQTGITDYVALYSSREFKKNRLRYFTGEIEQWEEEALQAEGGTNGVNVRRE